jgi:hypothetical protein
MRLLGGSLRSAWVPCSAPWPAAVNWVHSARCAWAPTPARVSPAAVRTALVRRTKAAGLTPAHGDRGYTAHSTRAGFATQAAANGASERAIMDQGRWKSLQVARSYIRRGSVFTDNAAGRLGHRGSGSGLSCSGASSNRLMGSFTHCRCPHLACWRPPLPDGRRRPLELPGGTPCRRS